jgi:hypothetical protein
MVSAIYILNLVQLYYRTGISADTMVLVFSIIRVRLGMRIMRRRMVSECQAQEWARVTWGLLAQMINCF